MSKFLAEIRVTKFLLFCSISLLKVRFRWSYKNDDKFNCNHYGGYKEHNIWSPYHDDACYSEVCLNLEHYRFVL